MIFIAHIYIASQTVLQAPKKKGRHGASYRDPKTRENWWKKWQKIAKKLGKNWEKNAKKWKKPGFWNFSIFGKKHIISKIAFFKKRVAKKWANFAWNLGGGPKIDQKKGRFFWLFGSRKGDFAWKNGVFLLKKRGDGILVGRLNWLFWNSPW